MQELARQSSALIQNQTHAFAQIIVTRLYKLQPAEWARFGGAQYEKSVRDSVSHLHFLAQALAVGSPQLFSEYVGWCKILFDALGFGPNAVPDIFRCTRQVLAECLPGQVAEPALAYIDRALDALDTKTEPPQIVLTPDAPHADLATRYFEALLIQDHNRARQLVLDAARAGVPIQELYLHVLQVSQREIGRRWHLNQLNVAQEHYMTAVTQITMAQLYPYLFAAAPTVKHGTVVVACVPGEPHELGARMLADFFEMDGWNSYFLGANTPTAGVIEMMRRTRATLLCLSVTTALNIGQLSDAIALLRIHSDMKDTRVLVGGYLFNRVPDLWQLVGADAFAPDAEAGLRIARALVAKDTLP